MEVIGRNAIIDTAPDAYVFKKDRNKIKVWDYSKPKDCPWCGQWTRFEFIRGHYSCISCKRPVLDCCDGEQIFDR